MEIREVEGKRVITGYVNVPNTFSNPLKDREGKVFIEKVEPGVFKKALDDAKEQKRNIPLMFRHKDIISENVEIEEDEVGVKFTAYDVEEEVFNQIREQGGKINCSFGFKALSEKVNKVTGAMYERILKAIELLEITVTYSPAYSKSVAYTEIREGEDEMTIEELLKLKEDIENQIREKEEIQEKEVALTKDEINTIANVVIEKLKEQEEVEEKEDVQKEQEVKKEELKELKEEQIEEVQEEVIEEKEEPVQEEKPKEDLEHLKRVIELLKLKG